jgi:hypothetical protein
LNFYSASSLKQQFAERHVALLGHIILIPSQPVFSLSPQCCVLSGEATNTNVIVVGLTLPGLKRTIYRTRGEHANNYTTDMVSMKWIIWKERNVDKYQKQIATKSKSINILKGEISFYYHTQHIKLGTISLQL